jgi:hypothetical protein
VLRSSITSLKRHIAGCHPAAVKSCSKLERAVRTPGEDISPGRCSRNRDRLDDFVAALNDPDLGVLQCVKAASIKELPSSETPPQPRCSKGALECAGMSMFAGGTLRSTR